MRGKIYDSVYFLLNYPKIENNFEDKFRYRIIITGFRRKFHFLYNEANL